MPSQNKFPCFPKSKIKRIYHSKDAYINDKTNGFLCLTSKLGIASLNTPTYEAIVKKHYQEEVEAIKHMAKLTNTPPFPYYEYEPY